MPLYSAPTEDDLLKHKTLPFTLRSKSPAEPQADLLFREKQKSDDKTTVCICILVYVCIQCMHLCSRKFQNLFYKVKIQLITTKFSETAKVLQVWLEKKFHLFRKS